MGYVKLDRIVLAAVAEGCMDRVLSQMEEQGRRDEAASMMYGLAAMLFDAEVGVMSKIFCRPLRVDPDHVPVSDMIDACMLVPLLCWCLHMSKPRNENTKILDPKHTNDKTCTNK